MFHSSQRSTTASQSTCKLLGMDVLLAAKFNSSSRSWLFEGINPLAHLQVEAGFSHMLSAVTKVNQGKQPLLATQPLVPSSGTSEISQTITLSHGALILPYMMQLALKPNLAIWMSQRPDRP